MQTNSQTQNQKYEVLINRIEAAVSSGIPVLLIGNPGVGKTFSAVRVCERLFGFYNFIDASSIAESTDMFVQPVLDKDGLTYKKTEVALYPERPVIIDELNRVQNERALNSLFRLDSRRQLWIPQIDEYVAMPKYVIATANIGSSFVGTVELDEALLTRFVHIRLEKPILISKYPLIERVANELKSATYRQIEYAELLVEKIGVEEAIILGFSAIASEDELVKLMEMLQ